MARPSKLVKEDGITLCDNVVEFLSYIENDGADLVLACKCSGLFESTVRNWITQANKAVEKEESELTPEEVNYIMFLESYARASGKYELGIVKIIQSLIKSDDAKNRIQADYAMKWLKMKYPERYSETRNDIKEETNNAPIFIMDVPNKK